MEIKRNESEIIKEYSITRNPTLREELVLRYLPLIHFVLGRLGIVQSMEQDYEDAVGQGILGLIEAVDKYDMSHGTQFSTYATLRIRGKIIDYLRSHDWLSRGARQRARQVQGAITSLWEKLQRSPTNEELAEFLNIDDQSLQQALIDGSHTIVSLDTLISVDEGDIISLHEILPDEKQPIPAEIYEERELREFLINTIKELAEREQLVLSLYYYEGLTFKEIGSILEISESRVCQLHARAVMFLRSKTNRLIFTNEANANKDVRKERNSTNLYINQASISIKNGVNE